MNRGEVTTLTLLDLSALFDNKPEYLTDLLVGPKCSKCLQSTNSNRFFVHLETKTRWGAFTIVYRLFVAIEGLPVALWRLFFAPNTCPLLFKSFPSPFSTSPSIFNASHSPFNAFPSRHSMPLRHFLPPYIAFQWFCVDLYRLFFAFLTPSRCSLMPILRHLTPLHRP